MITGTYADSLSLSSLTVIVTIDASSYAWHN